MGGWGANDFALATLVDYTQRNFIPLIIFPGSLICREEEKKAGKGQGKQTENLIVTGQA